MDPDFPAGADRSLAAVIFGPSSASLALSWIRRKSSAGGPAPASPMVPLEP
jgi:hypothetical protein